MIDINRHYWRLAVQLMAWSLASILLGVTLLVTALEPFVRGFALQLLIWGAVDAVLAFLGGRKSLRAAQLRPDEYRQVRETVRLRRLLRINARMDILYCLVGAGLYLVPAGYPFARGTGLGILTQGLFLLLFDAIHARRLPAETPPWYDPAL